LISRILPSVRRQVAQTLERVAEKSQRFHRQNYI
jgi:hypothetical protein